MIRSLAALSVCVLCLAGCARNSNSFTSVPHPRFDTDAGGIDVTVPQNWLAQKVCVDGTNAPVAVDPYSSSDAFGNGCAGYSERNIAETDSVPYYRYATSGSSTSPNSYWYGYAFPVTSPSGEQMFVMARELTPSKSPPGWYVNPPFYPAHTHWDLYRAQNSWISDATTRDASGMNQTFFGNSSGTATPYNGWIEAPLSFFSALSSAGATANVPVRDLYWELSGLAWPLPAQSAPTSTSTQTTWKLMTGYTFDSGKQMNALVAYHQPRPSTSSTNSGSMEVWYFTIPYGPSRWEVWSAASCLGNGTCKSNSTQRCNATGSQTFPYAGTSYTYYRTNCVDWTRTALATPGSTVPLVPVPETNLLVNMHFSNDPAGTSGQATGWNTGSGLTLSQRQSKSSTDTGSGKYAGIRYVTIQCNSSCSATSTLSQDIPIVASATYSFGIDVRTESGSGQMQLSLQQVDASGNVLPQSGATIATTVSSANDGCNPASVLLCSAYIGQRTAITLQSGATALRETIEPLTANVTYDITDAYVSTQ